MADPRDVSALRDLGMAPPARPATAGQLTAPAVSAAPVRKPRRATASPAASSEPPSIASAAATLDDRRSQNTTVYLDGTARARLEGILQADADSTVADAMLDAVRSAVGTLRGSRAPTPVVAADDPLPPPPQRRRRRRVEDGRAVPVRFSRAEREALDHLGRELGLSVSGLIAEALVTTGETAKRQSASKAPR